MTTEQLTKMLIDRPANEPVDVGIYIKLTASEKAILDEMAGDDGVPRNVLIRNLIIQEAKRRIL